MTTPLPHADNAPNTTNAHASTTPVTPPISATPVHLTPVTHSSNIIQGDHWRISVLSDSLIRLEWSDSGHFEDHATQTVVSRDFSNSNDNDNTRPTFTVTHRNGFLLLDTPSLRLEYDGKPFSREGLCISVKGGANGSDVWHYGDKPSGNLGGTARTLDGVNGRIDVGHGVLAMNGWAVLDDSASNIVASEPVEHGIATPFGTWVAPRDHTETDLYFFAHGRRYRDAIRDLYRLTGPVPLLPRFVFGNWWSRYHRYSDAEYRTLMRRFEHEGIPFSVAVIDMDWHLVDDVPAQYGTGWTGYTWNPKLFPNPHDFLDWLHEQGLKATLNVHPRDGVRAFEQPYAKIAAAMGVDTSRNEPVDFDLTNPTFIRAYLDMHHDLEREGVDFWWLDWQQGGVTHVPGLDPLWMLNYLHYHDSGRDGRWPLTFSRYAGPGSHRYPIGFSGDTIVTWDSLRFQPYFTATASNIGYGWWSHDIGGHMFGERDEELEARWYQLGTFSPINRLHSTDSPFNGKEPWNFHEPVRSAMVAALRLRQALVPYLYTMNWRAATDGMPLVEPMYWADAELPDAYQTPNEFRFGTELIVAPITEPTDRATMRAHANVWLPSGVWFDLFTGRRYDAGHVDTNGVCNADNTADIAGVSDTKNVADDSGNRRGRLIDVWRTIDQTPAFAKAGAIVPLATNSTDNSVTNPQALTLLVFPGASGSFELLEDDGTYPGVDDRGIVRDNRLARTQITFTWDGACDDAQCNGHDEGERCDRDARNATLTIQPVTGNIAAVPQQREWTIAVRGVAPAQVAVTVGGVPVTVVDSETSDGNTAHTAYDPATLTLTVTVPAATDVPVNITFPDGLRIADDPWMDDCQQLLQDAQIDYVSKEAAWDAIKRLGKRAVASFGPITRPVDPNLPSWLPQTRPSALPDTVAHALAEILNRC